MLIEGARSGCLLPYSSKYLSDAFLILNGMKHVVVFWSRYKEVPITTALEHDIRKAQETRERVELNRTHQLLG
jgi:hypothetical protein